MIDLGTIDGGHTYANAINKRGQVVGYSHTSGGQLRAFQWQNGVMTDLGTLGGTISLARLINNRGQVVGGSNTASGEPRAVMWTR
jgi:probable HAF family extracellular repeat protein